MQQIFRRRSTQIVLACGAFLMGILLGHLGIVLELAFLLPAAILLVGGIKRPALIGLGLILVGLTLGNLRLQSDLANKRALTSQVGQKVELTGTVSDDPAYNQDNRTDFHLSGLTQNGQKLAGDVTVRTHYIKLQRGYKLAASGKLSLYYGHVEFSFADVQVLSTQTSWVEHLRQHLFAGMRTALPEPLAAFALGLLMGTRALIPKPLQDQLARVGLAHLVAVSGYNLTIITESLRQPLSFGSRRTGTWLLFAAIGLFMAITGFSASIVRAGVVAGLSLWAHYYGRKIKPVTLIALAAAATLAYRPDYLWNDVGWQLSFVAFFGILVLAPAFEQRFVKRPRWFKSLIIQSLAAQLMTAPIVALSFGQFSVVAPLANALVLPMVPLAMAASVVAGIAGILVPALAGWLAWPASAVLQLILAIIASLDKSWASQMISITGLVVGVSYACIVVICLALIRSQRLRQPSIIAED